MKKYILWLAMFTIAAMTVTACCPEGCCDKDVDKWANDVVYATPGKVLDASNVIGKADNAYAILLEGGAIVVDMGEGEEICNTKGADIKFYYEDSACERVDVFVSDKPESGYVKVANNLKACGTKKVNFGEIPYDKVRYVKIVQKRGKTVEVDAVKGTCISCVGEVPEFTTIGAGLMLLGAGLYAYRKRK